MMKRIRMRRTGPRMTTSHTRKTASEMSRPTINPTRPMRTLTGTCRTTSSSPHSRIPQPADISQAARAHRRLRRRTGPDDVRCEPTQEGLLLPCRLQQRPAALPPIPDNGGGAALPQVPPPPPLFLLQVSFLHLRGRFEPEKLEHGHHGAVTGRLQQHSPAAATS